MPKAKGLQASDILSDGGFRNGPGPRPLHSDERYLVGHVLDKRLRRIIPYGPQEILAAVRRIDHQQVFVFGKAVYDQVVHDAAVFQAHAGIDGLSGRHGHGVVRNQVLYALGGVRAAHKEFAHVAYVEKARRLPHRTMFLQDAARIAQRHFIPGKRRHSPAQRNMPIVQRRFLKRCSIHSFRSVRSLSLSGNYKRQAV